MPWIDGLKFYELPKVSQRLVGVNGDGLTTNNPNESRPGMYFNTIQRYGIFRDTWRGDNGRSENVNAQFPWVTPSGLHDSPKDQWRKVGAVHLTGKVRVYRETVGVLNSFGHRQPQPHLAWSFPDGTTFAELLIRRHEGNEWPFEIRTYQVVGGKMTDTTTYRPDVETYTSFDWDVSPGKLSDFGLGKATVKARYTHADAKPVKLRATREVIAANRDDAPVPRGFVGNVRTCTDCHNQAGKSTSYGATTIRGSAPVLSWQPFLMDTVNTDAMPKLDRRWPIATE